MEVAQGALPFKVVLGDRDHAEVTAYAGLPLVVEAARAAFPKKLLRGLRDALGYRSLGAARRHLESLLLLLAAGGDCVDDLATLRADPGISTLLGYRPSSPTQMKDFLYRFHQGADGSPLTDEDDARLSVAGKAQIRPEGPGLRALGELRQAVVLAVHAAATPSRATLDVDATIVQAQKRQALVAYEGTRGYQPQMALWAELGVWVEDEFRDGNVPAGLAARDFLKKAFGRLPASVTERRLRADSALYDELALTWADDEGIEFVVSADMSEALAEAITALPDEAWRPYRTLRADGREEPSGEERQWAEVLFVPAWARNHKKTGEPFRYVAIRVRSRQRELSLAPDAEAWRCFAVVTNMAWEGERLLRWHREKQGTVEHEHGVIKNDLGAGTVPCGRFGANAAWWRAAALCHDLLQMLKLRALPPEMRELRPKALRFRLFNVAGRLLRHGGATLLRLSARLPAAEAYVAARETLLRLLREPRSASPAPAT